MGSRASRLRWPEWLIGAAGVVLLGSMLLLSWYQITPSSAPSGPVYYVSEKLDGWNGLSHAHWLLLLTILTAISTALFQAQRRAPALPVTLSVLASIVAGLTTIWLIVRVIIAPAGGRLIGAWIGLLATALIAYAGLASMRLEGIAPGDGPGEVPKVNLADEPTT